MSVGVTICEDGRARCDVFLANPQERLYHDTQWGVPVHDDQALFEALSLESLQCGLSWDTILHKRNVFREAFADFDFDEVAAFDEVAMEQALEVPAMMQSPQKVRALVNNARCFQKIRRQFGTFDRYLWNFSGGATILYEGHERGEIPAKNGLSTTIAHDLHKQGFKYVGPVIIYSFLQACGVICDHHAGCFRYEQIVENYPTMRTLSDDE